MLASPIVLDGQLPRALVRGDVMTLGEAVAATVSTTNITVTGAQLLSAAILRNPAATATDTLDTAENIRAAIAAAYNAALPNGITWRVRWIVTTAQQLALAATANTGVVLNRGTVTASAAAGFKDFLITITNGTPAQTFTANTTNGSAVITGLSAAQTALLTPGMIVTNAVNGLQGTTILSVQSGTGVTLSGNANATSTAPGVAISFSPVITVDGLAP